jgi:histidine kinase
LLLDPLDEQEQQDQVFKIVDHFNISLNQIEDPAEKLRISKLNWFAGQKEKASVAYASAVHYFRNAMALIHENGWTQYYDFMLLLHKHKAEAEFLDGNFERAEKFLNIAVNQTKNPIETADLYNSLILLYTIQGRYSEALEAGKIGLQLLGIDLSNKMLSHALDEEISLAQNRLRDRSIATLIDHPVLTDMNHQVAIKLLMNIDPVAYISSQSNLYFFVSVKAVNLSLQYGNIPESVKAYGNYGFMLGSVLGDYDSGYEFGLMARKLSKKLNSPQQLCKSSSLLSNWMQCWAKPIQGAAELNLAGYYAGIESGEVQFAAYNLFGMVCNRLFEGIPLTRITLDLKTFWPFLDRTKNQLAIEIFDAVQQFTLIFSPSENLNPRLADLEAPMAKAIDHILKIQHFYLLNDLDTALGYIQAVEQYLPAILGFTTSAEYPFYAALTLISSLSKASDEMQVFYWSQINIHQAKLKTWAEKCPDNFKSRYDLVQAEIARVNGESWQAINLYDQSIAQANQFVQIEAIACERTFEFYMEINKPKIAQLYLRDAHYGYSRWGAITKVRHLESQHKGFLNQFHHPVHHTHPTVTTHAQSLSLDLATVVKASQALSGEVVMSQLLEKIMQLVQENAGAQTVVFVAKSTNTSPDLSSNRSISKLSVEAIISNDGQTIIQSIPLSQCDRIPQALIHYVERSKSLLLLSDAAQNSEFKFDPYIKANKSLSILVFPIIHKSELIGILYLENNLMRDAFTSDRLEILGVLAAQAAISLENAQFYTQLETRVTDRTQELNNTLQTLRRTQIKLVHTEKMSSLGQLVAGIAHEINNPINFIYGNLKHTQDYKNSILELLNLYQSNAPQSDILEFCEEIDLEFIIDDLPKILDSMQTGATRVRDIVADLRNFARLDESEIKTVDLHTGLNDTLNVIKSRLSNIHVVKDYGVLPEVTCFAAELNQVFLNLFNNAIDTLTERKNTQLESPTPTLHILTESRSPEQVTIVIRDNGMGMSPAIVAKIFDPFFTTKPVGSGTGLGLAISHQVIVAQHHGRIFCTSTPNVGSKFTITLPTSFTNFIGENEQDIL